MHLSAYPEPRPRTELCSASHVLTIDAALPSAEADALRAVLIAREDDFTPARTLSTDRKIQIGRHRRARTLHGDPTCAAAMERFFAHHHQRISAHFGEALRWPARPEIEATASGDGDWFGLHSDDGAGLDHRTYTILLYLHRQPIAFRGGELLLCEADRPVPERIVQPRHNRAVMFRSNILHEILPVRLCGEAPFADSRFAITCWI